MRLSPLAPSDASSAGRSVDMPTLRVVIVEDDALIAMEVESFVEDAGHAVVATATTASTAIEAVDAHRPDVVLMDLRLADGSFGGDAAAREILRRHGIRSIFLSGNLDPETREALAELEPIALISKPFRPKDLTAASGWSARRATRLARKAMRSPVRSLASSDSG